MYASVQCLVSYGRNYLTTSVALPSNFSFLASIDPSHTKARSLQSFVDAADVTAEDVTRARTVLVGYSAKLPA